MQITSSREVYKCGLFTVTEEQARDKSGFDDQAFRGAA